MLTLNNYNINEQLLSSLAYSHHDCCFKILQLYFLYFLKQYDNFHKFIHNKTLEGRRGVERIEKIRTRNVKNVTVKQMKITNKSVKIEKGTEKEMETKREIRKRKQKQNAEKDRLTQENVFPMVNLGKLVASFEVIEDSHSITIRTTCAHIFT